MSLVNPYTVALGIVAAMAATLVAFGWQRRETPGALPFAAMCAGIATWALCYGLALATPSGAGHLMLTNLVWAGGAVIPTAWLVFALEHTGRGQWVTRRAVGVLAVEPAVTAVLAATAGSHGLFLRGGEVVRSGGIWVTHATERGTWFWVHVSYSYLLVLVGAWLLVEMVLSTRGRYRDRAVALLVGVSVPLAANLLSTAGVDVAPIAGLDLTPFAFAVTAVAFAWTLDDRDLFEVLPVVPTVDHNAIVDEIADGVIVVDAAGRIVECNPAARNLADGDAEGATLEVAFPDLAPVVEDVDHYRDERREVSVHDGERERYYEVQASVITRGGNRLGLVVTLHDVTGRVIRQQRLDVLNRVLRHNVRQETNLILGHSDILESTLSEEMTEHASVMAGAARNIAEWSDQARYVGHVLERASQERHPVDVDAAVTERGEALEAEYPDARVEVELDGDAWATAHEALADAVGELLENAVVHNDREEPRVTVRVRGGKEWVELEVADDGPGIPPEERAVFEHGDEMPLEHGSGLGLWLVSWIVRISGGTVQLGDNDPRGSVVRVRLPAAGVTHGDADLEAPPFPRFGDDTGDAPS